MHEILINATAVLVVIALFATSVFTIATPLALTMDYCWSPKWARQCLAVLSLVVGCVIIAALYELLTFLTPSITAT